MQTRQGPVRSYQKKPKQTPYSRPAQQPQRPSLFKRIKNFIWGAPPPPVLGQPQLITEPSTNETAGITNQNVQNLQPLQNRIPEAGYGEYQDHHQDFQPQFHQDLQPEFNQDSRITNQSSIHGSINFQETSPNETLRQFFEVKGDQELTNMEVVGVLSLIGQAVARNESLVDFSHLSNTSIYPTAIEHSDSEINTPSVLSPDLTLPRRRESRDFKEPSTLWSSPRPKPRYSRRHPYQRANKNVVSSSSSPKLPKLNENDLITDKNFNEISLKKPLNQQQQQPQQPEDQDQDQNKDQNKDQDQKSHSENRGVFSKPNLQHSTPSNVDHTTGKSNGNGNGSKNSSTPKNSIFSKNESRLNESITNNTQSGGNPPPINDTPESKPTQLPTTNSFSFTNPAKSPPTFPPPASVGSESGSKHDSSTSESVGSSNMQDPPSITQPQPTFNLNNGNTETSHENESRANLPLPLPVSNSTDTNRSVHVPKFQQMGDPIVPKPSMFKQPEGAIKPAANNSALHGNRLRKEPEIVYDFGVLPKSDVELTAEQQAIVEKYRNEFQF